MNNAKRLAMTVHKIIRFAAMTLTILVAFLILNVFIALGLLLVQ